ncbi:hypothetical protein [Pontibacter beigongshangensis]|nr:hypothetical protein [Pontibacter beigongshangensis]
MKKISTISSFLVLGTTLGFLLKSIMVPANLDIDLKDEDYHLYL